MRPLPALAAGSARWVLPISDRSATAIVDALLTNDPAEAISLLAETLAADPPLAIWAGCRSAGKLQPESLQDLARWLYEHALEALPLSDGEPAQFDPSQLARGDRYADLVAKSLQVASLAALLAEADGRAVADKAYLMGLAANAADWIAAIGHRLSRSASRHLPEWFTAEGPATLRVREAMENLAGTLPASELGAEIEACRRQAAEGRRRWLESVPGPGRRLPVLLARLARLDELERRFAETVEREKLAAMAEFAAGAGHEINNPLAIIAGRAQLCLRDETDPERRRELALINAQVKRAYEMIADMRLFARPPRPELKTVELASFWTRWSWSWPPPRPSSTSRSRGPGKKAGWRSRPTRCSFMSPCGRWPPTPSRRWPAAATWASISAAWTISWGSSSPTTAPAFCPRIALTSSIPSTPPARPDAAWAWDCRSAGVSSACTTGG